MKKYCVGTYTEKQLDEQKHIADIERAKMITGYKYISYTPIKSKNKVAAVNIYLLDEQEVI